MPELVQLVSTALPTATIMGFRGREAVSELYEYQVLFAADSEAVIDFDAALTARATLGFSGETGIHAIHGVIASLEHIASAEEHTVYLATVVPLLWHLQHSVHSRIFTDGTIPEIIEAVLKNNGLGGSDYRFELSAGYATLEHVCQYRESSFNFICRLMEREGMYYFFDHQDDKEVLVITDARTVHTTSRAAPVPYHRRLMGAASGLGDGFGMFRARYSAQPARVQLHDYNYSQPALEVQGEANVPGNGVGDIVLYGENFKTPAEGQRYALLRAEELTAKRSLFTAHGDVRSLRSGYLFTLEQHPRPSFNDTYLVTAIEWRHVNEGVEAQYLDVLDIGEATGYNVTVHAIPSSVQFRAPRTAMWPRVDGVVDGVVDGAQGGPYAEIDDQGRYKVQIFFDESDLLDGSKSTWVRMLQPHGGGTEGFHFPLRKETEVHIIFLGGDPDRPVIVGVAPNPHTPSPVTSGNNTTNVVQTGGANRLELGDAAGGQYCTLSTPTANSFMHMGAGANQMVLNTDGNSLHFTNGDHVTQVCGTQVIDIGGAATHVYMSTLDVSVTASVTNFFQATFDETVIGAVCIDYQATLDVSVTSAVTTNYLSTFNLNVTSDVTHIYSASLTEEVASGADFTFNSHLNVTVNGPESHTVNGNLTETVTGTHAMDVGSTQTLTAGGAQTLDAPSQTFQAAGAQSLTSTTFDCAASASASIEAPTVTVTGTGSATIEGSGTLDLLSGGTGTLSASTVAVAASGPCTISAGPIVEISAGLIKLN